MNRPAIVRRHNLRLRVLLCGVLVEDRVVRRPYPDGRLDALTGGAVPILDANAKVRWVGAETSVLVAGDQEHRIAPDSVFRARVGDCEYELSLVPEHQVVARESHADLWLPLIVLAAMVLGYVLQTRYGAPAPSFVPEPSPELIARLLNNEIEGAREGLLARIEARPDGGEPIDDVWMPAGARGPTDRAGGAETPADALRKQIEEKKASFQPLKPRTAAVAKGERPAVEGVIDAQKLTASEDPGDDASSTPDAAAAAKERGFGLEDWYDTEDARRDSRAVKERLDRAEELVELDPDASWALLQLAYYQYLSSDYAGCRRTYERFIELYPDDATGYNNLALVFKRLGEYSKEEGYYRLALALEPGDENVMNNLAVNLAHQERFTEALAIMDELAARNPDDPYADLHRAKIFSAQGDYEKALFYLEKALAGMKSLDTFHHIEFRQDIRLDPAFAVLRQQSRFNELLARYYGDEARAAADQGGDHG